MAHGVPSELNTISPWAAYATKDNILLPAESPFTGAQVAVLADTSIEEQLPAAAGLSAVPAPTKST